MREVKRAYTVEDVADRATRVIHWLVGHGVTLVRSYVDVDTIVGLTALEGVLAARERCRRLAHVELIAFPQEGIWCDPGTDELMRRAVERGADVVGGMPFAEMIESDSERHIDFAFAWPGDSTGTCRCTSTRATIPARARFTPLPSPRSRRAGTGA
jgi:cytosine deaminase